MRTDHQLGDFLTELCLRAKAKYGDDLTMAAEHLNRGQEEELNMPGEELTEEEWDRLGELIVETTKAGCRLFLTGIPHFVAYRYSVEYAVYYSGLVSDLLFRGPAHFREQAEAKIAEFFGEEVAAAMCGMKGKEEG